MSSTINILRRCTRGQWTGIRQPKGINRHLSSTRYRRAALASNLTAKPTVVLTSPSLEYLKSEEIDVELIPKDHVKLVITDRAAEVRGFTLLDRLYSRESASN
jgi:hypothetical protein